MRVNTDPHTKDLLVDYEYACCVSSEKEAIYTKAKVFFMYLSIFVVMRCTINKSLDVCFVNELILFVSGFDD